MIQTVWPYLAVMLLAAGIFPALERRTGWKFFSVFPPIVLVYLSLTALAVIGLWQVTPEIKAAQGLLIKQLVPALIFLLMVNCDLRAIFALGPRVLAVFFCTSISLFIASTTAGCSLWPCSSVSTQPGSIAVTRTPAREHSWRSASENPTTPHLVML